VTGRFFQQQAVDALCAAIVQSQADSYDQDAIRRHAETFDRRVFEQRFQAEVEAALLRKSAAAQGS
jgi:hypothetical protein